MGSYKPICFTDAMGKVLEKLILKKTIIHQILIPEQIGFRSKHCLELQLARLLDKLTINFNLRKKRSLVLLDLEKAYDTIWRDGLIYKLSSNYKYISPFKFLVEKRTHQSVIAKCQSIHLISPVAVHPHLGQLHVFLLMEFILLLSGLDSSLIDPRHRCQLLRLKHVPKLQLPSFNNSRPFFLVFY